MTRLPSKGAARRARRRLSLMAGALWCGGLACTGGTGETTTRDGSTSDGSADVYADVGQSLEATPAPDAVPDASPSDLAVDMIAPATDAAAAPLTVEALQVAGTHNSYHIAPIIAFDASHKYTQKPLDQQLDGGVRALELDLHLASDGTFDVYHITIIDAGSTCQKLDNCLGIVGTWSTAHPRHVPIFVWLEIKDDTGGQPITDLTTVEAAVLKVLPSDRLITPAWLRGNYGSPHERITTAGWPTLDDARGKIMLTVLNQDARTQAYAHGGTSLDDRALWISAPIDQFAQPWAVITKDLEQATDIAAAHAAHLLIGVNTCAINMTDDACSARLTQFQTAGVHMLDDDLPFQISGRNYWLRLPAGSPGCNPVTAPAGCRADQLE